MPLISSHTSPPVYTSHMEELSIKQQLDEIQEVMDMLVELPNKLRHEIMVCTLMVDVDEASEQLPTHNRCHWASMHSSLGIYTIQMRCWYGLGGLSRTPRHTMQRRLQVKPGDCSRLVQHT